MQDNTILIIAGIFLIIAVPCYLLYLLGMYVQKKIIKKDPSHPYVKKQTGIEITWMGVIVACLLIGISIYELSPDSSAGSFLNNLFDSWYGWLIILVALFVIECFFKLIGFLLRRFGSEN